MSGGAPVKSAPAAAKPTPAPGASLGTAAPAALPGATPPATAPAGLSYSGNLDKDADKFAATLISKITTIKDAQDLGGTVDKDKSQKLIEKVLTNMPQIGTMNADQLREFRNKKPAELGGKSILEFLTDQRKEGMPVDGVISKLGLTPGVEKALEIIKSIDISGKTGPAVVEAIHNGLAKRKGELGNLKLGDDEKLEVLKSAGLDAKSLAGYKYSNAGIEASSPMSKSIEKGGLFLLGGNPDAAAALYLNRLTSLECFCNGGKPVQDLIKGVLKDNGVSALRGIDQAFPKTEDREAFKDWLNRPDYRRLYDDANKALILESAGAAKPAAAGASTPVPPPVTPAATPGASGSTPAGATPVVPPAAPGTGTARKIALPTDLNDPEFKKLSDQATVGNIDKFVETLRSKPDQLSRLTTIQRDALLNSDAVKLESAKGAEAEFLIRGKPDVAMAWRAFGLTVDGKTDELAKLMSDPANKKLAQDGLRDPSFEKDAQTIVNNAVNARSRGSGTPAAGPVTPPVTPTPPAAGPTTPPVTPTPPAAGPTTPPVTPTPAVVPPTAGPVPAAPASAPAPAAGLGFDSLREGVARYMQVKSPETDKALDFLKQHQAEIVKLSKDEKKELVELISKNPASYEYAEANYRTQGKNAAADTVRAHVYRNDPARLDQFKADPEVQASLAAAAIDPFVISKLKPWLEQKSTGVAVTLPREKQIEEVFSDLAKGKIDPEKAMQRLDYIGDKQYPNWRENKNGVAVGHNPKRGADIDNFYEEMGRQLDKVVATLDPKDLSGLEKFQDLNNKMNGHFKGPSVAGFRSSMEQNDRAEGTVNSMIEKRKDGLVDERLAKERSDIRDMFTGKTPLSLARFEEIRSAHDGNEFEVRQQMGKALGTKESWDNKFKLDDEVVKTIRAMDPKDAATLLASVDNNIYKNDRFKSNGVIGIADGLNEIENLRTELYNTAAGKYAKPAAAPASAPVTPGPTPPPAADEPAPVAYIGPNASRRAAA